MASQEHLEILRQGVQAWNKWRKKYPCTIPDLRRLDRVYFYDTGLPISRLRTINFGQYNLTGAKLNNAVLPGANLEEADLQGANLQQANLKEANLNWTNLEEANLKEADLERASLKGSELSRADLSEANLTETDFSEAMLCKAILRGVNLSSANLDGANLNYANLSGANLSYASLISTNLGRASLVGANLQYASLGMTEVSGADFRKALFTQEKDDLINFLGLCFSEGLEAAKFSDADFLHNYLAKAFEYTHQPDIREELDLPGFLDDAINNIAALHNLYNDQLSPEKVIEVVGIITYELINYLKAHPKALYEIKPRQFEGLIAEVLASYGWQVDLTPSTRDGGYDIYAISPVHGKESTSWIIECKKYASDRKVGIDIVRALYGLRMDLQIANAMLATTSYFSRDAHAYKASRYDLKLKDYGNILEWISQYRPNPDGKLYIKNNRLIIPGED